jgi:glycosyltransferase involved in cell wall biosynthesis
VRVLLLHNRYRLTGGEERAVSDLHTLLRGRGHDVHLLERSSDEAGNVTAARGLLRGGVAPDDVAAEVRRLNADVVHAHNLHPLLGWRALAAAQEAGARTVLHLHNFRLFCAISIGYRDGGVCFRCRGRNTWPGLKLRCRGSVAESAVYAAGLSMQLRRMIAHAERIAVVSQATAARLHELGLPTEGAQSLPNFVPADRFAMESVAAHGEYALIAGRIVEEKGFDTAIVSCVKAGVPLVIAGEGPDAGRLHSLAAADGATVRFTGRLSEIELTEVRRNAAFVLAPSRWEEPCPYSVLDAMAAGVPVLGSAIGGLPELLERDELLPVDDAAAWAAAVERLWTDRELRAKRGAAALRRAHERHGEDRYYESLIELYG